MGGRQRGASGKPAFLVAVLLVQAAGHHPSRAAVVPCVCPLGAPPYLAVVAASMQLRGGGRVRDHDGGSPGAEDLEVCDKEDAERHERGDSPEKGGWGRGREEDRQAGQGGRPSHDK